MKNHVTRQETPVRFNTKKSDPAQALSLNSKGNRTALKKSFFKAETKIARQSEIDLAPQSLLLQLGLLRPKNQSEEERFKWDYLFAEATTKWPHGEESNPPELRESLAIMKLMASNDACKVINDEGFKKMDRLPAVLHTAQRIISQILCGKESAEPTLDCDGNERNLARESLYRAFARCSLPAGASTSHPYIHRALCVKYKTYDEGGRDWTVTRRAEKYFLAQRATLPWLSKFVYNFHLGNEVFTVDKTSVIDRAACKESLVNANLQRAAGGWLRGLLKKVGVDLDDQTRNQMLALSGSISDEIATIDLSSASDLNSDRLIWSLLPPWFYDILNDLRSHYGTCDTPGDARESIKWELFSTMGNGFTFELESLVFYALAKACAEIEGAEGSVTVYGDDIICPSSSAPLLLDVLTAVGHKPNRKKTFIKGPFRESCGKHYYNGFDVTPFYFRKAIDDLHRVHWFLNRLRIWSGVTENGLTICDPTVYPLWLTISRRFSLTAFAYEGHIDSLDSLYVPYKYNALSITESFKKIRYTGYGPLFKFFQNANEQLAICKYGSQEIDMGSSALGQNTDKPLFVIAHANTDDRFTTDFNNYRYPQEESNQLKLVDAPLTMDYAHKLVYKPLENVGFKRPIG